MALRSRDLYETLQTESTPFDMDLDVGDSQMSSDRSLLAQMCNGDQRALSASVPVMIARLNQLSFNDCTRLLAAYHRASFALSDASLRLLLLRMLAVEDKTEEFETISDPRLLEPIISAARQLDHQGSGWLTRMCLRAQLNDDSLRSQLVDLLPPSDQRSPKPDDIVGRWFSRLPEQTTQPADQIVAVIRKDGNALFANQTTKATTVVAWHLDTRRYRSFVFEVADSSDRHLSFSLNEWQRVFRLAKN